jgi:hypothetical protein
MVRRLVKSLGQRKGLDTYVYDDGSRPPLGKIANATVYNYEDNAGKLHFWFRVWEMLEDAREAEWDRLLWLPDDVELVPDFWNRLDELWDVVTLDPLAVCLNPLTLAGHPCIQWVDTDLVKFEAGVHLTQWMDCCGLVTRRFVELAAAMMRKNPYYRQGNSSGVGRTLSLGMDQLGYHLYQASETLLIHGDHPSVMHPDLRTEPLTT